MEARTLKQLIEDCREELDDAVEPYLYSDQLLTKHLNEAVEEACIRARLLVESSRADICTLAVKAGQAEYTLHPSVFVIRRAQLDGDMDRPLCRSTSVALDCACPDWQRETGEPRYLLRDSQTRRITLVPMPTADAALRLVVWRVPAADEMLDDDDDEPIIDAVHHRKLVHWACHRAFNKKDSERGDQGLAQMHFNAFEEYFGLRPTARSLQQLSIDPVSGSAACWF